MRRGGAGSCGPTRGCLALLAAVVVGAGFWIGFEAAVGWLGAAGFGTALGAAVLIAIAGYLHFRVRRISARACARRLLREGMGDSPIEADWIARAFEHGTSAWRTMWLGAPAGWGSGAKQKIANVLEDTGRYVQRLNDRFADPSGRSRGGPDAGAGAGPAPSPGAGLDPAPAASPGSRPAADSASGPDAPDRGDRDEAGEGHRGEYPEPAVGAPDRKQAEEPRL